MKKLIVIAGMIGIVVLSAFKLVDGWYKYVPEDGSFSVSFPGKPTESVRDIKLAIPDSPVVKLHIAMFSDTATGACYFTGCTEYGSYFPTDKTTQKILEDSRDGAVANINATAENSELSLMGHPHISFKFTSKDFVGKSRIYVIGKVQYQVLAIYSVSRGISPDADKFINSFVYKKQQ